MKINFKNQAKKYILGLSLFTITLSSCDKDFENVNKNPNVPLTVTPELLIPSIVQRVANRNVNEAWGIGNIVMQYTAKIQFVNEDRYLWGELNGVWNDGYTSLRDVQNLIDIAKNTNRPEYEAVGLILKSYIFGQLTDTYGDVPYSEAIGGKDQNYFPKYDTQESIYTGLLADLVKANELIKNTPKNISGDLIYGGNITKWRKLANTLRFKMLMRISNVKNVANDLNAIFSNPSEFPIFENNADDAALTYLAANPNQFPIHTSRIGSFDEIRLSKTLGDTLSTLKDPRLQVIARPTAASTSDNQVYAGIPNGLNDVDALTYNGGAQNISRVGKTFYEDAITPYGLKVAKGLIMTYTHLQFLLAEAAQRGLISGDAETFYNNGVKASFDYYELPMPAGYMDLNQVKYNSSNGAEQIAFQRWIGLFFNGLESWFEWRRTDLPKLTPGRDNLNNNKIPVRYIYPVIEQALNSSSRAEAVGRQGADDINTKVWWDK